MAPDIKEKSCGLFLKTSLLFLFIASVAFVAIGQETPAAEATFKLGASDIFNNRYIQYATGPTSEVCITLPLLLKV